MKLLIFYLCLSLYLCWPLNAQTFQPTIRESIEIELNIDGVSQIITLSYPASLHSLFEQENLKDINTQNLNLNQSLHHLDSIHLQTYTNKPLSTCISINFASVDELETLTGIGEKTALAIIDYRENYGLFQTLEDIMLVSGIKEVKYEGLKDEICL